MGLHDDSASAAAGDVAVVVVVHSAWDDSDHSATHDVAIQNSVHVQVHHAVVLRQRECPQLNELGSSAAATVLHLKSSTNARRLSGKQNEWLQYMEL